ncbi:putative Zn-dependent peptidase [Croceifilum oryzae]|uniref:Zn-dependent peptidase n=1 Tax=Croceifilum oryzae TaxID=1553429 RepID=A0AAJ1WPV8_9BACL|nr:pitrilysin family protein [Croceifilum oryzae]MDQ0416892.1 putative Zn-dependent peptidase [Croceifilum oryzae]
MTVIIKHTLPNGVRIVAESIPHVRSIALGIWTGAGSERETPQNNGISHFIEHMLFKGTATRTARQLAESFDEIGGQVNAFTAKEMTCYYAKVLDEHFPTALDILTDMLFHSEFRSEEIEKEKKVIIEEVRMVEDTPDDLVHDLLAEASLGNHSLGLPVIGTVENIQSYTRDQLLSYMNDHYHPHNVIVSIAGNLPENFLQQIEEKFANYSGSQVQSAMDLPVFTPQQRIKQKVTEQTHLCVGLPGLAIGNSRLYQLILLNNILGGNMSSRLFQEIREERGLAYSVFSYHSAHKETGVFAIYAGTAPGQEEEVMDVIHHTLDQVMAHGITDSELRKAKEQLKSSIMLGLESTNNRMSRLGRNEILLGRHYTLDEIMEHVTCTTLDELNEMARTTLSSPMSLAIISPDGKVPNSFRG